MLFLFNAKNPIYVQSKLMKIFHRCCIYFALSIFNAAFLKYYKVAIFYYSCAEINFMIKEFVRIFLSKEHGF